MKIFSWNVRGINSSSRQRVVRDWVRVNRPVVGSILETRTTQENSGSILASLFPGWRCDDNYFFSDLGRIWIVWDPSLSVIVYKKSAQYILCGILDPSMGVSFSAAFVYAFNSETQRKDLWRDISELNASTPLANHSWVLLGDFNQIISANEHYSVPPYDLPLRGMAEFRECLDVNSLSDLASRRLLHLEELSASGTHSQET